MTGSHKKAGKNTAERKRKAKLDLLGQAAVDWFASGRVAGLPHERDLLSAAIEYARACRGIAK